ncbi:MAG: murein biosynthesis integral membrane protein MurJ [Burkholderiaceae bacterium]|nr:murein biosynthesis integral membrane protein MurJ [Burkholderiaceae bacterium]
MNLFRALATVSSLTLLSRITGLARDMLISRLFGASAETDAFNVAFRLPNLLRRMFAEGAFQQAFVPMLADVRAHQDDTRTGLFVGHVASALFWVLLVVSVLGVVAAPVLVWLVASGLARDPSAFDLAATMTRWMFPYILFMSLVALAAGVLNTWKRFAVPAFTPVLLNVSFIACALWLAPRLEHPIMALAFAVVIGGVLQLALQWTALLRTGIAVRFAGPREAFRDPRVGQVARLMLPAIFAVSVAQISIIINTNIASHLVSGSVTWLAFADRLMEFPTALLGVALGTVLLPNLSAAFAEKRADDYARLLDWGLRLAFLLALPAAVGLGLTAEGIVTVLFQGREFSAFDVKQTSVAVVGYAIGLIGLIGVKILAPGFYAQKDIRTPVKIAVAVLIATQLANLALVPWLAHAGLAVSVSLGACANAAALFIGLKRRGLYRPQAQWGTFLLRLLVALAVLATVLWAAQRPLDWSALQAAPWQRAGWLALVIGAGTAAYFTALALLGFRPRDFRHRA